MNWLDFVLIGILSISVYESWGQSFLVESYYLFTFSLAFILSLSFYNYSTFLFEHFHIAHSIAKVLGFMSIWFIVEALLLILLRLTIKHVYTFIKFDRYLRYLAFIPGLFRGLLLIGIVLMVIESLPLMPMIKSAIGDSSIATYILVRSQQFESPIKSVFGDLSQDTLTVLTVKPASNEKVDLGFQTSQFLPAATKESQMIDMVNKERTSRGFKPLTYDVRLQQIARAHSADMFVRGYFSHYAPEGDSVADRAKKSDINYTVIGENLAYAPSLDLAHNGLMNSPGHRANILSSEYDRIGIGIMDGGSYGLMVTQVFLAP